MWTKRYIFAYSTVIVQIHQSNAQTGRNVQRCLTDLLNSDGQKICITYNRVNWNQNIIWCMIWKNTHDNNCVLLKKYSDYSWWAIIVNRLANNFQFTEMAKINYVFLFDWVTYFSHSEKSISWQNWFKNGDGCFHGEQEK